VGKVYYNSSEKILFYLGPMSEKDKYELMEISEETQYMKAVLNLQLLSFYKKHGIFNLSDDIKNFQKRQVPASNNFEEQIRNIIGIKEINLWEQTYLRLIKNFEDIGDKMSADDAYFHYRHIKPSYELQYLHDRIEDITELPIGLKFPEHLKSKIDYKYGSSTITMGDIFDFHWGILLRGIQRNPENTNIKLLTSKLKEINHLKNYKTINVNQITDDIKRDIIASFNDFKDDLKFYERHRKDIKLSARTQMELNNLEQILGKSGELKIKENDLSESQKEDIKWFNIAILKDLFSPILSKGFKSGQIILKGVMTDVEKEELLALHEESPSYDSNYNEAIKNLYERSQNSLEYMSEINGFRKRVVDCLFGLTCGYGVRPFYALRAGLVLIIFFTMFYFIGCLLFPHKRYLVYQQKKEDDNYEKLANILVSQENVSKNKIDELQKLLQNPQGDLSKEPIHYKLYNCFYFSVTTFTTVGYGDLHPQGGFKVAAMIEGFLGWMTMALFLVTLGNVWLR
jgi:hypothetical protein